MPRNKPSANGKVAARVVDIAERLKQHHRMYKESASRNAIAERAALSGVLVLLVLENRARGHLIG